MITATDTNIDISKNISKNINNVYGHTNIVNIYWHISGIHEINDTDRIHNAQQPIHSHVDAFQKKTSKYSLNGTPIRQTKIKTDRLINQSQVIISIPICQLRRDQIAGTSRGVFKKFRHPDRPTQRIHPVGSREAAC